MAGARLPGDPQDRGGHRRLRLWSTVRVINESNAKRPVRLVLSTSHYVLHSEKSGFSFLTRRSPTVSHGVCLYDDKVERLDSKKALKPYGHGGQVHFAGAENVYFGTFLAPDGVTGERCQILASSRGGTVKDPIGTLFQARVLYPRSEVDPGKSVSLRTLAFMGPKSEPLLDKAGHHLSRAVDLGFFSILAHALAETLGFIHGLVGNWGIAIILLTVLVKLVLYPLTEKSFRSMARMRRLKPDMDRINELYKEDREKKGAAMMELYRKEKINPLGGCLPSVLQMPVWFALYASLSTNIELYHQPFVFWLHDLSAPDPFYVLPLLLGVLMFLQQRLTPTTMDPTQAKMMQYFMPLMITAFMLFLPAGLCLYMVTNSTLGIAQQSMIQVRLDRQAEAAAAAPPEGGEPPETSPDETGKKKTATRPGRGRSRNAQRRQRRGRA